MKKAYITTIIVPLVWGILMTVLTVFCFLGFVIGNDQSSIIWAIGIILGWCVTGLGPLLIAVTSYRKLSVSEKES